MIRQRFSFHVAIVCMFVVLTTVALAQGRRSQQRGGQGWGPASEYGRLYDPATVQTVAGEVIEVTRFTARDAVGQGVHLTLKTSDETVAVHLGPDWFIEKQDLQIETNDQVSVTGSRVTFEDKAVIIAAEIKKGDDILALRDEDGVPRWSASRERGPRMGRRAGGWSHATPYGRLFNPATVETITGEVVEVAYFTPHKARGRGVHLTLRTQQETIPVHLGPAWFMENQEFPIEPKDIITVRGSRVTADGTMVLIVAEVRKGDDVLELRDAHGYPRWSGWRRARTGP